MHPCVTPLSLPSLWPLGITQWVPTFTLSRKTSSGIIDVRIHAGAMMCWQDKCFLSFSSPPLCFAFLELCPVQQLALAVWVKMIWLLSCGRSSLWARCCHKTLPYCLKPHVGTGLKELLHRLRDFPFSFQAFQINTVQIKKWCKTNIWSYRFLSQIKDDFNIISQMILILS